ncbi:uncharacterized protein [Epargyreus clarus]|uniref:uncharacterized protein n=1 Tax=Epargyreus clarus TaxID=520877 RepID=UPI003C2CA5B7
MENIEIIEEENPLKIVNLDDKINEKTNTNSAGRPKRKNEIKFGPEPKSVISQLLRQDKLFPKLEQINNKGIAPTEEYDTPQINNKLEPTNQSKSKEIKIYNCDHQSCTYTSKSSSNMIKHKRRHTSEKRYMCDQCTFRTNFINSLTVHKRIHSGERPYVCEHCSYRCNSSSNLKKHCMHKHSGVT